MLNVKVKIALILLTLEITACGTEAQALRDSAVAATVTTLSTASAPIPSTDPTPTPSTSPSGSPVANLDGTWKPFMYICGSSQQYLTTSNLRLQIQDNSMQIFDRVSVCSAVLKTYDLSISYDMNTFTQQYNYIYSYPSAAECSTPRTDAMSTPASTVDYELNGTQLTLISDGCDTVGNRGFTIYQKL